jgi:hypothetical protein
MSSPFLYNLNSVQSSLLLKFCQVCLIVKETAEIETGMAEKSRWDQANIRQKLGLVWRNRKKISKIIKDYFYFPFFLLIILCPLATDQGETVPGTIPYLRQCEMYPSGRHATMPGGGKSQKRTSASIATLPPFGPLEGQKWFDQMSSQ